MNKELQQLIISVMTRNYSYYIFEFKNINSDEFFWGIQREFDGFKECIVFASIDELNIIRNSFNNFIQSEALHNKIEAVIIILQDNSEELHNDKLLVNKIESFYMKESLIVLNTVTNNIVYSNYEGIELPRIIQAIAAGYKKTNAEKEERSTLLTKILITANVLVFLISALLSKNIFDINTNILVLLGAKENTLISQGEFYRLFTAMFLHGGLVHIGFNMYALYSLGPLVEHIYGKKRFLAIYLISGITSSLLSFLFSDSVSVGASGAIFGLLGAALIFGIKMKKMGNKNFLSSIVQVIVINLFLGFTIPNIDNFGHLGGLIGGIIIAQLLDIKKGKET